MITFKNYINEAVQKSKPYSAHELLKNPTIVPKSPGLYFWWLKKEYAQKLGIKGGHTVNGSVLVYHGTGKDLNQRLVKWELSDLKGIQLRVRKTATTSDWVKSKGVDSVKNLPGVAQPARTLRALLKTHWLDYAATEEFLNNLHLTFAVVDIKAPISDKEAWKKEYHKKVVQKHETSIVKRYNPALNISQLADKALKKERVLAGKVSKQKTLDYIKDLFGDDVDLSSSAADIRAAIKNKQFN